ncbi:MAG: crossover junction endodeoxyribonuclease RuvC [Acidobacteriota bacterium]
MIALGVDSGSRCTGYGVVEGRGPAHRALAFGAVRLSPDLPHSERLALIGERLRALIGEFHPEVLALEGVFMAENAQSALKLGQVRGAVMLTAAQVGVPVLEISPAEVKAAVTGYGRAEKVQVQKMVQAILGLPKPPTPLDASDALALAICALARSRLGSVGAPR